MRLILLFATFALLALALETTVPHLISYRALVPNLIVILAVDLGFRHHGTGSALLAFLMGYATDTFAGTQPGVNAFAATLVFLVSFEISSRLLVTNAAVGAAVVMFGVFATALATIAISAGFRALVDATPMMPSLLLQAAVSALVAPLIFALLARSKRAIGLPVAALRE